MKPKSVKRTSHLIADFEAGFATDWFMAVKESFRNELDIKYLPRKKDKITFYEWSQGPYYCFSQGQTFYDSPLAYVAWKSAIKNINTACQIIDAQPNIPVRIFDESVEKEIICVKEGHVRFVILKPNKERTKLMEHSRYELSQNNFVDFLKTGELPSSALLHYDSRSCPLLECLDSHF